MYATGLKEAELKYGSVKKQKYGSVKKNKELCNSG